MNLKGLVHRELGEGLTGEELASAVGVSERTIAFCSNERAESQGIAGLKKGDLVEVTVNDQNLLVDVYKAGESGHHRVVRGQLAGPVDTGHDKAVIRTTNGKDKSHLVRPVASSIRPARGMAWSTTAARACGSSSWSPPTRCRR